MGGFYDNDNVYVLVRVSLTHDVNFYILNTVWYVFVNDHIELSWVFKKRNTTTGLRYEVVYER